MPQLPNAKKPDVKLDGVRMPPRYYKYDLFEFCALAKKYNAFPIIVYTYHGDFLFQQYIESNHIVADLEKVPAIEVYPKFDKFAYISYLENNPEFKDDLEFYKRILGKDVLKKNKKLLLTTDGFHPNRIGHKIIAEEIYITIKKNLAMYNAPLTEPRVRK